MDHNEKKYFLSVILPAYNEEAILEECVSRLSTELEKFTQDYEMIIVNDGSKDSTRERILELKKQYRSLRLISYKTNRGKGHAIRRGFEKASGEYIVIMDADLEIDPCQIEGYVSRLKTEAERDVHTAGVIGCKFDKDSRVDFPKYRKIMSMTYFNLLRLMFKFDVKDTQTGLKCFKGDMIKQVLPKLSVDGFAYDVELLTAVVRAGGKISQAPVVCEYGRDANRMSVKHILETFGDTVNIYIKDKQGNYKKN